MIIVTTSPAKKSLNLKKPLIYTSLTGLVVLASAPVIIALSANASPTGTYLNPLPENELAQAPSPTPTQSPQELILTAQAYLEKAITLSSKDAQTDVDKQQIIEFLNAGLEYANLAVTSSPNTPESYLVRARILASSTAIRTDAVTLAQKDLETAQLLSGGQPVTLPTKVNLLDFAPTSQASLASNIIIAAPEEEKTSTASAQTDSNINKKTATIAAGKSTVTIKNSSINENSYIYLIPLTPTQTPFVQTKTEGQATIALTGQTAENFEFEYWIVNP